MGKVPSVRLRVGIREHFEMPLLTGKRTPPLPLQTSLEGYEKHGKRTLPVSDYEYFTHFFLFKQSPSCLVEMHRKRISVTNEKFRNTDSLYRI